jgi:hypothetical protein
VLLLLLPLLLLALLPSLLWPLHPAADAPPCFHVRCQRAAEDLLR